MSKVIDEIVSDIRNSQLVDGYTLDQRKFLWSIANRIEAVRAQGGEAVAYLDVGASGHLDLGTDLNETTLKALPPGRHMLGIIGTYGTDGYTHLSASVAERLIELATEEISDAAASAQEGGEYEPSEWASLVLSMTTPQPAQQGSVPEWMAERVLASLGHHETESPRCRARYKDEQTKTDGPKNPPIFCVLEAGHDGQHRGQHGEKMRDNLIEFGPAISICAKCKVRWPCPDAEKALKAATTPQPADALLTKCAEVIRELNKHDYPTFEFGRGVGKAIREFEKALGLKRPNPPAEQEGE